MKFPLWKLVIQELFWASEWTNEWKIGSRRTYSFAFSVEWHCSVDSHTALVFYDFNFEIFSCKKFYDKTLPGGFFFSPQHEGISHSKILHRNQTNRQPRYHHLLLSTKPFSLLSLPSTQQMREWKKKTVRKRKFIDRNMSGWFLLVEAMQIENRANTHT